MTVSVIDFGAGNIFSVCNALKHIGVSFEIVDCGKKLVGSEKIIIPGVGSFAHGASELDRRDLRKAVVEKISSGIPTLGICLGMHLLFDESEEGPGEAGLGIISGKVVKNQFSTSHNKLHVGWNEIEFANTQLTQTDFNRFWHFKKPVSFYFLHSYSVVVADSSAECAFISAYGELLCGFVKKNNVVGVQFHPEKSGTTGIEFLKRFLTYEEKN